ncbi:MAG: hypothetical protein NTW56_19485 [Alphaproteobacteria bacterium]|jgi:hypothetical protein|nr:hypothetical protein [Alphaproteobacteria bacterium]
MFRRPILLLVFLLLCAAVGGVLWLAAFPPAVPPAAVERTLPNDRFNLR